jgi:CRISPR-associated endonuclease Cas2
LFHIRLPDSILCLKHFRPNYADRKCQLAPLRGLYYRPALLLVYEKPLARAASKLSRLEYGAKTAVKWIIAYDVRKDKGRRRIAKRLEQLGFRRQKSVFEGEASPTDIGLLLDELVAFIQADHDVLTAWPMTENGPARIQHRGDPRAVVQRDWMVL